MGHRTTVLTLASADVASRVPGLARRLRTVSAAVGGRTHELTLFEGRALMSDAQLLVLAAQPESRAETAALLAAAVRSLANDKLISPEVTIGWGEPTAAALSATSATVRLFVLPTGRLGPSLAPPEAEILGPLLLGDESASHSLVALGCLGANAIVAPSPSAARATEGDPGLASRASDEPVIAVRFGCDDPPNDPASDPALPANFSAAALSGKAECRRAISRRCSLALGPRTLLLTTGPLHRDGGADAILAGIERLAPFDVATIIVPRGEADVVERARLLALKQPGRVALYPGRRRQRRTAGARRRRRHPARRRSRPHRPRRRAGAALRNAADRARGGREPRLPGRLRRGAREPDTRSFTAPRRRSRSKAPFGAR